MGTPTVVMIGICNKVGDLEKNRREYRAMGTAVYFQSPQDMTDTPMVHFWIANRFITVLSYVIHLHLAISLKSSLDQKTL
jgi:hypothetical protein